VNRLLVSATHKSSGKTTVALGLCAALAARGVVVQPFKKGPDYIDPMWLARAAGRACLNLDAYLMDDAALEACFRAGAQGADLALVEGNKGLYDGLALDGSNSNAALEACFRAGAQGADLALVEGNKGLYDGLALDGSNSNAALATRLALPVLLVIDARGMTRGIAPIILGHQAFDRSLRIGGVILNRLGGSRHEAKLRAVIEHYTDVPVLGALHEDARLAMVERHLGLVPCAELDDAQARVRAIGEIVAAQVDLDRVRALAASAAPPQWRWPAEPPVTVRRSKDLRIGIARDRAFGFYYPDDLAALEAAGAELVPIDTLSDRTLPALLDGLIIGGGFPETCMAELEANAALRAAIRRAIEGGLPTYAECGGLMYLARSIAWRGRAAQMVGVIPGDAVMHERPVGRGYVHLAETGALPWPGGPGEALRGHEFHHSTLENLDPGVACAYRVERGHGLDGARDGILMHRMLASYTHLRSAGTQWAPRFAAYVRSVRAPVARAA
jgi:cobyrinic acid a,c-diamide synthase